MLANSGCCELEACGRAPRDFDGCGGRQQFRWVSAIGIARKELPMTDRRIGDQKLITMSRLVERPRRWRESDQPHRTPDGKIELKDVVSVEVLRPQIDEPAGGSPHCEMKNRRRIAAFVYDPQKVPARATRRAGVGCGRADESDEQQDRRSETAAERIEKAESQHLFRGFVVRAMWSHGSGISIGSTYMRSSPSFSK